MEIDATSGLISGTPSRVGTYLVGITAHGPRADITATLGFVIWLITPRILLGAVDWRHLLPGATLSAVLAALLTAASGIYIPIVMTWSAERYGLIGIAFTFQSWLLASAFVIVVGAVVGAVTSERMETWRRRTSASQVASAPR